MRVREAGGVTAVLTHRLFCRQDVSLVSCACEGECVAIVLISYLTFYYNYVQSFRLIMSLCLSVQLSLISCRFSSCFRNNL